MFGATDQCAAKRCCPFLLALTGERIDEVEADSFERSLRDIERGQRLGGIVGATEEAELRIIERLDAERQAVDTGLPKVGEALYLD